MEHSKEVSLVQAELSDRAPLKEAWCSELSADVLIHNEYLLAIFVMEKDTDLFSPKAFLGPLALS